MRYLVTGATGLVGNNVVRQLLARGDQVRVLVRRSTPDRSLAGLDVELALGDVTQPESLAPAVQQIDCVIHAAAAVHIGWKQGELLERVNVQGTRHIARAARLAGARFVQVSSVDALGIGSRAQPANEETLPNEKCIPCPYVLTKRASEQVVLHEVEQGLHAVIVNPVFMLGPWDWKPSSGRMLLQIAKGWCKLAPPGGNDFLDIRDAAHGILLADERGQVGRRYILGGEPLSFLEAWKIMAEITGVKPPWRNARWPVLWSSSFFGDLIAKVTGHEPDLNSASVAVSKLEHHFDSSRAQQELGYSWRPAREAIQAAWDWFLEHGYAKK
jgi:dihydroflavonol-4-reductase